MYLPPSKLFQSIVSNNTVLELNHSKNKQYDFIQFPELKGCLEKNTCVFIFVLEHI